MAEPLDNHASRKKMSLAEEDAALRASLPPTVTEQPDPMLQMSTGRVGWPGLTLFAVVAALILAVVFYGLNGSEKALPGAGATASNAAPAAPASPQKTNNKG